MLNLNNHWLCTPGKSKEFGEYWSLEKPTGSLQSSIDLATRPEWANLRGEVFRVRPSEFTTIQIPAGTKIYAGEVGNQGGAWVGGNSQIYIAQDISASWKIGGGSLQ